MIKLVGIKFTRENLFRGRRASQIKTHQSSRTSQQTDAIRSNLSFKSGRFLRRHPQQTATYAVLIFLWRDPLDPFSPYVARAAHGVASCAWELASRASPRTYVTTVL